MPRRSKGQSTLEYALIVAVVVGALVAMNVYMKRGLQGRLRESADQIGEQFDANNTTINRTTTRTGTTVQTVNAGTTTTHQGDGSGGTTETRTESGSDTVGSW